MSTAKPVESKKFQEFFSMPIFGSKTHELGCCKKARPGQLGRICSFLGASAEEMKQLGPRDYRTETPRNSSG
jgi:hypothetical protein